MHALFPIILPLLAIRLFLNPVPSLSLSSPNPPPLTTTAQYSYLNHIPAFSLVLIFRSSSSSPSRPPVVNSRRNIVFILLFLWRCRNHSRSKLSLLSSPTQVLERNIYSLLSQYPLSFKCQKLYCIDRPRFLFS